MTVAEGDLQKALKNLPEDVQEGLVQHGFEPSRLIELARQARAGLLESQVSGQISPPESDDIVDAPAPGTSEHQALTRIGEAALREGQCALVVLAGGMATRMGGVVKSLVEALPGHSFLDLRVEEQRSLAKRYGATPPLWLMTSLATEEETRHALGAHLHPQLLQTFVQDLSVRLTPETDLFLNAEGEPSLHSPGHGDLPDALARSGLLRRFVDGGGRYVLVTNLDNLGGGLDPALIGLHLSQSEPVTCEVVEKSPGDRGGIPARLDDRPVVLEEFRLPREFDPTQVSVFNVNSFGFNAQALLDLEIDWTYFRVEKTVDDRPAIQFERLINEVTFTLPTRYVRVPRQGVMSRFLPVKDFDELRARQPDLQELAAARGML